MTAKDILTALPKLFAGYCIVPEFRAGTGYAVGSNRYLDAWMIQPYPSSPMIVVAVEIKVSRSDFRAELRQKVKRDSALRISNQFYFACPQGLVKHSEIPEECGLIEVSIEGNPTITEPAPHREFQITLPLLASLARRARDGADKP